MSDGVDPARNQTLDGAATRGPERSGVPPREGLPDPPDPSRGVIEQHYHKHPSDFHADCAVGALIRASQTEDTLAKANELAVATVYAQLSVRDALLEVAATVKEVARVEISTMQELSVTMKQAANSIHAAVREVKAA